MEKKNKPQSEQGNLLLGRYELGRLLGHGTFAKVYLARNALSNETVAIKVLDKDRILKSGLTVQIKREISILRRLRHPNIVRLYEVMATKAKIYFVMEYVRGGELFHKVAKGRLKEDLARKYFQQLIGAVGFCHGRGIYHRDLKPENLLLDENGDLKVSDFGLSAVAADDGMDAKVFHTFCGTPAYVAPEVLARKGYDGAKVDIWSCGVILFVLMAGYLPFHDQNIMSMYKKIYKGQFRCPRWFSPDLSRLLTRLLDTNPTTRITISEIMNNRWFKKDYREVKFYVENDRVYSFDDIDTRHPSPERTPEPTHEPENHLIRRIKGLPRPASLNAFDIISYSSGCDLSGLFEEGGKEKRFVSEESVESIIEKMEEIANIVKFAVRKKGCSMSLAGPGTLAVAAEVFELTPSLVVVEVKKEAGNRDEYEEFCENELRPRLQNLMFGSAAAAAAVSAEANAAADTKE